MDGGNNLNIGINAGYFLKGSTDEKRMKYIFKTLADNGISYFDFMTNVEDTNYLDNAEKCRQIADETGTVIHQSHCPMGRYKRDKNYEDVLQTSLKSVEAAAILGTKFLVVHADENRYNNGLLYDGHKIMNQMYEYISKLVEKAAPHNIIICVENLFEDGRYPEMERSRFTSEIDELLGLIELFDKDNVGICWDFGHANVAFGDESINKFKLALPRIYCTHVHDNNGKDEHRLPFRGKVDWYSHIPLLVNSGYSGNLSFELVHGKIPDELLPDYIGYCKKLGSFLINIQR